MTDYYADPDERLSEAVLAAMEEAGVSFQEADLPLHAVIDSDALDDLFVGREHGTVSFEFQGYHITVSSNGRIRVEKQG